MSSPVLTLIAAVCLGLLVPYTWARQWAIQREHEFAARHGCEPLRPWAVRWPFGLDLLYGTVVYSKSHSVLHFFVYCWGLCPLTHEQKSRIAKPSFLHLFVSDQRPAFERGIGTIEAQNLEAILSKQSDDFELGIRSAQFGDLLGHGIFTQDGSAWKASRDLLRPQFASNRFQNFEQIARSVEKLLEGLTDGELVDLQPLFFQLTLETTLFLLFGSNASFAKADGGAQNLGDFAAAFHDAQEYLIYRVRLGGFYGLLNTPHYRKTCRVVHEFVDEIILRALDTAHDSQDADGHAGKSSRYVFIDALVQQTQDKKVLRDQCLNVLLAGRDTTACCLSWTVRLLVRHQVVLARLLHEIASTVGLGRSARQPTRDDLKAMPYLGLVIKEVLRLYPSVPLNARAAAKTTTLPVGGGPDGTAPILVRKGQSINWAPYVMHRRKDLYGEDAEEFRPERWEDGTLNDIGYAYLPFNGGPRVCLGQEFALLETSYTVVRLLQFFPNLALPEDEIVCPTGKEKQRLTLVVSPVEGCKVKLSGKRE